MSKKGGLGRGLSSLIPTDLTVEGANYQEIDINAVVANPRQPREHFDQETMASLAQSISEVGLIQPIVVRRLENGAFELIAGERRWRAAKRAKYLSIPAIVREADDLLSLETAVVENLHRQNLNALEEAAAYQQLMEVFGLTQERVARRVGKSRPAIANTLRLLHLPPIVKRYLKEGQITAGHARALLATPDRRLQERLARQAIDEALSVRQLEELISEILREATPQPGGEEPAEPKPKPPDASMLELESLLANRLDTRVSIRLGKGTGKIVVDFADINDLERIYMVIAGEVIAGEASS